MRFKLGDKIILGESNCSSDFQKQKDTVVSKEEFLKRRSGSSLDNNYLLLRLDRKIHNYIYWQADPRDCSLLKRPDYNE